jgi:hypothetical protein
MRQRRSKALAALAHSLPAPRLTLVTPATRSPEFRWPRAILLVLLGWWTVRLATGAATWCFLDFVNLAFHEAGHVFLSFAGPTVHYLGGTLAQLAVPAGLVAYFLLRVGRPFSAAICAWWLGESLINVSVYMADARELSLPLVGGGDHDWNELFYRFGLLGESSVARVATSTHLLGVVLMVLGFGWAVFFVLPEPSRERLRDHVARSFPWLGPALG